MVNVVVRAMLCAAFVIPKGPVLVTMANVAYLTAWTDSLRE